jgi:hypothetical protein
MLPRRVGARHCEPGNPLCYQRQALLQWAYDSRKI